MANHSSYVDGLALLATVPGALTFVAKQELAGQRIAGPFLRGLGALFVERFDPERGVDAVRVAARSAEQGRRLLFFPEGTLARRPGLLPFHLGAFVVAAQSGLPVSPVTLRGTRSLLRGGQWWPRRGAVQVEVAPALWPDDTSWRAAVELRDRARREILEHSGEPDLADENQAMLESLAMPTLAATPLGGDARPGGR